MNNCPIKYSVVIPHYRNLELLDRCIKSISVRQDIEIIIVDDNSGILEEEFYNYESLKKSNVRILFSKIGGSAGRARNIGLKHALGKWLLFVDADDFILDKEFLLCDKYFDSNYDIIYFGVRSVDCETLQEVNRYKVYNKYIDMCDNASKETINLLRFRHDVPWGKMIRHKLVADNNIVFGETKYCNDTLFSTLTALYAKSVFADKTPFYCVTERNDSLTKQKSIKSELVRYEVMLKKNQILSRHNYVKYQVSVLHYLSVFLKSDIRIFLKAIYMAVKYKINPFYSLFNPLSRK